MVPDSLPQIRALAARPPARSRLSRIAAVELMVIEVVMSASRMPSKRRCMSARNRWPRRRAHFARRQRMVRIHSHLRWQIECHRKAGGSLDSR